MKEHVEQQGEYRDEQELKTIQGRMKLKGKEMAKQQLLKNA